MKGCIRKFFSTCAIVVTTLGVCFGSSIMQTIKLTKEESVTYIENQGSTYAVSMELPLSYCSLSQDDSFNKLDYTMYGQGDLIVNIENQGELGLCWDFAATKAIETTIQKKYGTVYDFSERYVDFVESQVMKGDDFWRELAGGGSFDVYEDYLRDMNGKGLVNEANFEGDNYMLYTAIDANGIGYCTDKNAAINKVNSTAAEDIYIRKLYRFSSIEKNDSNGISEESENVRNEIKKFIIDNGAVMASANFRDDYYNEEFATLFQDGNDVEEMPQAHAFAIIGYDDTFPMERFVLYETYKAYGIDPSTMMGDGAYICTNSYGTEAGKNGYFFVSYYDYFIERDVRGLKMEDVYMGNEVKSITCENDEQYQSAVNNLGDSVINANEESKTIVVPIDTNYEIEPQSQETPEQEIQDSVAPVQEEQNQELPNQAVPTQEDNNQADDLIPEVPVKDEQSAPVVPEQDEKVVIPEQSAAPVVPKQDEKEVSPDQSQSTVDNQKISETIVNNEKEQEKSTSDNEQTIDTPSKSEQEIDTNKEMNNKEIDSIAVVPDKQQNKNLETENTSASSQSIEEPVVKDSDTDNQKVTNDETTKVESKSEALEVYVENSTKLKYEDPQTNQQLDAEINKSSIKSDNTRSPMKLAQAGETYFILGFIGISIILVIITKKKMKQQ